MLAADVARAVTGRHKVLMARYGYHGSLEDYEVGSSATRAGHAARHPRRRRRLRAGAGRPRPGDRLRDPRAGDGLGRPDRRPPDFLERVAAGRAGPARCSSPTR